MIKQRLLERIRDWETHPDMRSSEDRSRVIESISRHLQNLLNLKKGTTLLDREIGMPEFSDFVSDFPDSVRDVQRAAKLTIEKYEPRLGDITVNFISNDENDFTLYFEIRAVIKDDKTPVFFNSKIGNHGEVQIRN
jgi:type VI secretion system protein